MKSLMPTCLDNCTVGPALVAGPRPADKRQPYEIHNTLGIGILSLLLLAVSAFAATAEAQPAPVTLQWLGDTSPATAVGVSWGVPWPKGAIQPATKMRLATPGGQRIEIQTWPLAYWPDGSLKWTGHAIAAPAGLHGPLQLTPTLAQEERGPVQEIKYSEEANAFSIDTGALRVRIAKQGENLVETIAVGARIVAQNGKLIVQREDRSRAATEGIVREENFTSRLETVELEQSGPVRAVVKLTGKHRAVAGDRTWLPFTVRLQFFAGSGEIKLTHSFIYDGNPQQDFIKGLGLSFAVPLKEELHNRHIRFVGDGTGVWPQPVRMLPGYREQAGERFVQHYPQHLGGERMPNLAEWDERLRNNLLTMPLWGDAKLSQVGPNNWSISKRTTADASWLHVTDGHRSRGLALLADVSGGLAVGVKDFWQKAGKSFEITRAATDTGELKIWLWSPDAGAMDLRRYDEIPHGLSTNYEDWKPGWGTPLGIANTHDLTLWAFDKIPSHESLVAMADAAAAPPILVCAPAYYHAQQAVGRWSLPDRSTPALRWVETQVETLLNYYRDQVDERSWYGFWDFGDIMHNYDFGRHEWRYDVGGWAWVNTELMPDILLWYSFLRTGRADLFRMAEAMTRHTSEVDVHHIGPFAPLGTRHNVNHWGDGAKQPRVSHAGLKRHYYFLTGGDGRIGDLLREQINADLTYNYLQRFNNAHYVPNPDGTPRLQPNGVHAPRPEQFEPLAKPESRQPFTRFGAEWTYYALNWTTEWERGLDPSWRPRIETAMKAMAAGGQMQAATFGMLFGGPENLFEMEPMYDIPEFWNGWANAAAVTGRQADGSRMTAPRLLAYAAHKKKDPELGRLAWEKLIGPPGKLPPLDTPKKYSGAGAYKSVTDPAFVGAPVGWQLHGVASIHWALNAIEVLEFAKEYLPAWESGVANPPAAPQPASNPATP